MSNGDDAFDDANGLDAGTLYDMKPAVVAAAAPEPESKPSPVVPDSSYAAPKPGGLASLGLTSVRSWPLCPEAK